MSDSERPDRAAFAELEQLVKHLGDELASFRRRALQAEARIKSLESTGVKGVVSPERVQFLEKENAGLASRLDAAPRRFAEMNRRWHERARERHPDWPAVSPEAYLALAGATAELARSMVYAGRTDALPDLEDTLVALNLAVLAGRPWPPGMR